MKAPHDSHHEEVPSGTGYRSQRPLRRKPITKKLKTVNAEWKIWRNRADDIFLPSQRFECRSHETEIVCAFLVRIPPYTII